MTTGQITLKELLRDPQYKEYFQKVPKLPEHYNQGDIMPWKLLILKPGESAWRSKRFLTYREAFEGLRKVLPTSHDAAINCPALGFMPPTKTVRLKGKFDRKGKQLTRTTMWQPRIEADMEAHNWCPHCRRPTVWKRASLKRPARKGYELPAGPATLRCGICGISDRVVNLRYPETNQGWDSTRAVISA